MFLQNILPTYKISSQPVLSQFIGSLNQAWGLIPLGRLHLRLLQGHFYALGLTNQFTPASVRPVGPCHPLQHPQDLSFLTSRIPIQADLTIFTDASTQGWGTHMRDTQISGTSTRSDRNSISIVCSSKVILALHQYSASGPLSHNCYR